MAQENTPANTVRDGNIAIREEYDMAMQTDTIAALQLFILRHPDHPLAIEASERLTQLLQAETE